MAVSDFLPRVREESGRMRSGSERAAESDGDPGSRASSRSNSSTVRAEIIVRHHDQRRRQHDGRSFVLFEHFRTPRARLGVERIENRFNEQNVGAAYEPRTWSRKRSSPRSNADAKPASSASGSWRAKRSKVQLRPDETWPTRLVLRWSGTIRGIAWPIAR